VEGRRHDRGTAERGGGDRARAAAAAAARAAAGDAPVAQGADGARRRRRAPHRRRAAVRAADARCRHPAELYNIDRKPTADGLAALPRDYAGLPRSVPPLGPPLPGDLGRPIVSAQQRGHPSRRPEPSWRAVDPAEQRRLQEMEAARVSRLFVQTEGPAAASPSTVWPGDVAAPGERRPADEAFA
jgi:hypothetical protein